MLEKLLKTVLKNLNLEKILMYTVFNSMFFISVASEPVCIVLKCQNCPNRKHSNAKMLHKCGYHLSQFV